jgi:signal transduction histidine kinase
VIDERVRLHRLIEAGIALSSELSLDALLQKLAETTAELTGARYAALGVIDQTGRELERFVTHGIGAETHAAIGDLPRGRGILGVLIRESRTLRLEDLSQDPRSVGFPPNHPPMKTFLGVPVMLRGVAYGNLYLTEKEGGAPFTAEDEELVTLLASQAAVAIENARLYESSREWARQLESLNEITAAMVSEVEPNKLLELVVTRLRELVDARLVAVFLPTVDGALELAAANGEDAAEAIGFRLDVHRSKAGRAFSQGASIRVDSLLDDPEIDPELTRRFSARAGLWVPLLARGKAIGVLMALDRLEYDPRFSDADVRVAETFADRAAVAVDLSQRVARDTVRRIIETQELERRRLARELHDETAQALTSILLGLKRIEDVAESQDARAALSALRGAVVAALQDVRRLAVELRPRVLDDLGLVAALERLTSGVSEQSGMAVELEANLGDARLPEEIETVLYRVIQEALNNVLKHAGAKHVSVVVSRKDGSVTAVVEDDGRGFVKPQSGDQGVGLLGMGERLALVDGRLTVESREGAGTTVVAEVPLP